MYAEQQGTAYNKAALNNKKKTVSLLHHTTHEFNDCCTVNEAAIPTSKAQATVLRCRDCISKVRPGEAFEG